MKTRSFKMLSLLVVLVASLNMAFGAEQDDLVSQAVFTETPQVSAAKKDNQRRVGLLITGMGGTGAVYEQALPENRSFWSNIYFQDESPLFVEKFSPSQQMAAAFMREANRQEVALGIDQTFHLTENKYWGFVLGAGIAVRRSEYESKYYPEVCSSGFLKFCGFDLSKPTQRNQTDLFMKAIGRLGVTFREIDVLGTKANIVISLAPELIRFSERPKFIGPDGREVKVQPNDTFLFEGTIEI